MTSNATRTATVHYPQMRKGLGCWLLYGLLWWAALWLTATSAPGADIVIDDSATAPAPAKESWTAEESWMAEESWTELADAPRIRWIDRVNFGGCECAECEDFHWEFLPRESLYPFYLADTKQSRLAGQWLEATGDSSLIDSTLGGRFGIFRYVNSTTGPFRRGIQADFEGSAQVRLDMSREHDVRSVDFRAGVPISMSFGRVQTRFGYYHLSSHVGDEFLLRLPNFPRLNYSRDVLFVGGAYWLDERTRIYGETGWAFLCDVADPWEFIFGIEEAPRHPTGVRGAPFYAINARLREEIDFGGAITAQFGWAWRSAYDTGLLRTGFTYFNGKSNQFSFYNEHEELIGVGLWYDF